MLELRGRRHQHGASDLRGKHAAVLSLDLCSCKKHGANLACQGCHLVGGNGKDAMAHRQRSQLLLGIWHVRWKWRQVPMDMAIACWLPRLRMYRRSVGTTRSIARPTR